MGTKGIYPKRKLWHGFAFLAAPVAWVILHSPHSPNASPRGSTREEWRGEPHWRERGQEGREETASSRRTGGGISKKIGE